MKRLAPTLALALLAGCTTPTDSDSLELSIDGLPDLDQGTYAAWLKDAAGAATLVGDFTDGAGASLDAPGSLDAYNELIVTIEQDVVPTDPSDATVLFGAIEGGVADLAFAFDASAYAGRATQWTPTDGVDDNHHQGVWFMVLEADAGVPALELPEVPAGWLLEGWVTTQGVRMSTGQFSAAAGNDSACTYCGAGDLPGVPGEDFVDNLPTAITDPIDLGAGDTSVVVSLSPDVFDFDTTGEGIFDLSLLELDVAANQAVGEGMDLTPTDHSISGSLNGGL